jgi:putative membrane protein
VVAHSSAAIQPGAVSRPQVHAFITNKLGGKIVEQVITFKYLLAAIVYSALGIAILCFSTKVFDWMTPGDMWKDIVVEKNVPLAIVLAAMVVAVGNIVAAAIHG